MACAKFLHVSRMIRIFCIISIQIPTIVRHMHVTHVRHSYQAGVTFTQVIRASVLKAIRVDFSTSAYYENLFRHVPSLRGTSEQLINSARL